MGKKKDLEKKVRAEMDSRLKGKDLEKKVRAEMNSRLKGDDLEKKVRAEMDSRLKKKDLEKKVRAEMDSRLKGEDLKKAAEQPESELQPLFAKPGRQGGLTAEGNGLIEDAMKNKKLVSGKTVII